MPLVMMSIWGCSQQAADKQPTEKEIFKLFESDMKQTATAAGYLNYRLVINNLQQANPTTCNTPDGVTVPCFPIKIDRTEYYDNYTGRYTTIFTNDEYRLYRNEQGKLAIASHTAGQTNTVQSHRQLN